MITLWFTLLGMSVLMLQVLAYDTMMMVRAMKQEIEECYGHDTKIYPDYEP